MHPIDELVFIRLRSALERQGLTTQVARPLVLFMKALEARRVQRESAARKTLNDAYRHRATNLCIAVANILPVELVDDILQWLVHMSRPSSFAVEVQGQGDIKRTALTILDQVLGIPQAAAYPSRCNTINPDLVALHTIFESTKLAILKTCTIVPAWMSWPNKLQSQHSLPALLAQNKLVRHIHLDLCMPTNSARVIYPRHLIDMQDNLHLVERTFAALHSIRICVYLPDPSRYPTIRRSWTEVTSLKDELELLLSKMEDLQTKKVILRVGSYGKEKMKRSEGWARTEQADITAVGVLEEDDDGQKRRALIVEQLLATAYGEWWIKPIRKNSWGKEGKCPEEI